MSLLKILLRNLPSFPSLLPTVKVLVTRRTPRLDGLVPASEFLGGGGGIGQAYYAGDTPPEDTTLPWFDTVDHTWNTYDEESGVWVVTSGVTGQTSPLSAALMPFTPAGSIEAANVQAAIEELDNDPRMDDARPASDVYDWAKAVTRPSDTAAEVATKQGEVLVAALRSAMGFSTSAGLCFFSTVRATTGLMYVSTTTGYARVINPDGTLGPRENGGWIYLTIPASGSPRAYGIMSVTSSGVTPYGSITYLSIGGNQLTSFSGTGLSALTELYLYDNPLASCSAKGLTGLVGVDFSGCRYLKTLDGAEDLTSLAILGSGTPGMRFTNNEVMTSEDFNNLFTSLPSDTGVPATLDVSNTVGGPGCDETIATDKGYTVVK